MSIEEKVLQMQPKQHLCPKCGSKHLDSYKGDNKMCIRCDDCGYVILERKFIKLDIDYGPAIRAVIGVVIFTVIFAFCMRFGFQMMGIGP